MRSSSASLLPAWVLTAAVTGLAMITAPASARSQTAWDPYAIVYHEPPAWQQAAVTALVRHLPTDSGFFVLGPLDLTVDLPDTTDLVRTTLRLLAPDPASSRTVSRRLWVPTGGVALEELQPSDTLPHALPPGYPGRFLKGTIVGEDVLVQVYTVQEHRWLLWAKRAQIDGITEEVTGPIADYSRAVRSYLAAIDSGVPTSGPPSAAQYGLEPLYELYAMPPEPVIRDRDGYLGLLDRNRSFSVDSEVKDVLGFIPGPRLIAWLEEQADDVLFPNKSGELILQRRYRDFSEARASWFGRPVLNASTLPRLSQGRYVFVVDRYGILRVSPVGYDAGSSRSVTESMLAHGDPVRVAGELVLGADPGGPLQVRELSVRSEDYFFSNRSLTLYPDIEQRSDRYVVELGHALQALDLGRIPRDQALLRKF